MKNSETYIGEVSEEGVVLLSGGQGHVLPGDVSRHVLDAEPARRLPHTCLGLEVIMNKKKV